MTLPDWIIERIRLGEVPPEWRDRVAAAESSPEVQRALAELERSDRAILAAHPPAAVAAKVAPARPSRSSSLWFVAGPIAAAAALLLWLSVGPGPGSAGLSTPVDEPGQQVRLKGGPALLVYRAGDREPEMLVDGAHAEAGDRLQLGYRSAGARFGVILSFDGAGAVTVHWPEAEGVARAAALKASASLPFSYELDDAPDFERFVFVTSDERFGLTPVIAAAQDAASSRAADAPLELAPELRQSFVTLLKGDAP